jgi:hypothetical protein
MSNQRDVEMKEYMKSHTVNETIKYFHVAHTTLINHGILIPHKQRIVVDINAVQIYYIDHTLSECVDHFKISAYKLKQLGLVTKGRGRNPLNIDSALIKERYECVGLTATAKEFNIVQATVYNRIKCV